VEWTLKSADTSGATVKPGFLSLMWPDLPEQEGVSFRLKLQVAAQAPQHAEDAQAVEDRQMEQFLGDLRGNGEGG
jgi:hypothetical protein